MSIRVYLAGPDVFMPDPVLWLDRKKAICAAFGLQGIAPLDSLIGEPADWAELPDWRRIALRNEAHIRGSDALIANLTPFRGPSADAGTIYELGYARGLGRKLFGYATVAVPFLDRTLAHLNETARQLPDGSWRDPDDMLIEQFGLFDNLMIEGGIHGSGGALLLADQDSRWKDLRLFEQCVEVAARMLANRAG
jgi:nucleoside 2-deoxyribosyltransferase